MTEIPRKALDRQRCGKCGNWLEPSPESSRRTEMPDQLFGFPVAVICSKCMAEKLKTG